MGTVGFVIELHIYVNTWHERGIYIQMDALVEPGVVDCCVLRSQDIE